MSTPQQVINTGLSPNDGTGESLRNAFEAVNNNFANVWAAGPVDSNVAISNNVISTTVTNLDLKLAPKGLGNVVITQTLRPSYDTVYNLGTAEYRWAEAHATYYYGNGSFLTGIAGTDEIKSGTSNVKIVAPNGNVAISVNGTPNVAVFSNVSLTTGNVIATSVDANTASLDTIASGNIVNSGAITSSTANLGNLAIANSTIGAVPANTSITLAPTGTGIVSSTGNVVAPYFIGNVIGNISANILAPGSNTQVMFNDNNLANAVPGLTFNKTTSQLNVAGNVNATAFNGDGYGLNWTMVDRGGDTTNWNLLFQMGTYLVNRLNWGGVTGAPLDSTVYQGLLEVKIANTQGLVYSVTQSYFPGTVDSSDPKIQWNRNFWNGTWTQWIKMTNDGQAIDGGLY
jgi:hypothetical protein